MDSRKLSGLLLSVFTLSVLVAPLLSSKPKPPVQPAVVADGWPIPPLPPKPPAQPTVVADGIPIPPLPPPRPNPPAICIHA